MWVPLPPHMSHLLYSSGPRSLGTVSSLGTVNTSSILCPQLRVWHAVGAQCISRWWNSHFWSCPPSFHNASISFLHSSTFPSIYLFIQELKHLSSAGHCSRKRSLSSESWHSREGERHRPACRQNTFPDSEWYRRWIKIKVCEGVDVISFPAGKGMFPVHYCDKSSLKRWHLIIFKVIYIFVNISESTEEHNVLPKPPSRSHSIPSTLSVVFMFKCTDLYPTL